MNSGKFPFVGAAKEELEDIKAIEESMKDPGLNIPWEKVKKELGLL